METTELLIKAMEQPDSTQRMREILARESSLDRAMSSVGNRMRKVMDQAYQSLTPEQKEQFDQTPV